jgi:hypothetical protein
MANLPYLIGTGTFVSNNTFLTKLGANLTGLAYGVTDGSAATVGTIGEYQSAIVNTTTPVSLTSVIAAQITSLTLQPGDWDLTGDLIIDANGTATVTDILASINITVDTTPLPSPADGTAMGRLRGISTTGRNTVAMRTRANITIAAAYLLVAQVTFTGTGCLAVGALRARRMR